MMIRHGDQIWTWESTPKGKFQWSTEISFPGQVILEFDGRTDQNTRVDDTGKIIEDRAVIIEDLALDGMSCWQYWLDHKILLDCFDGKQNTGRYINGNGQVVLDFDTPNAFFWIVRSKVTEAKDK